MKTRVVSISALMCLLFNLTSHAGPVITGVQGTLEDNTRLIITGTGFGSGPTVEIFESFESGVAGDAIPFSSPRFGFWSGRSGSLPIFDHVALSGSLGFRTFDSSQRRARQLLKTFSRDVTEVFVSFWIRIPDGTFFPGATQRATLPLIPTWKLALLTDGPDGLLGNDDLALPLFAGERSAGDTFKVSGIDFDPGLPLGSAWWLFTDWMRLSFWLSVDPLRLFGANGLMTFQSLSRSKGVFSLIDVETPLFDGDDNTVDDGIFRWTQIAIPGPFVDVIDGSNVRPAMDDIYIASGPNAQARVEISDSMVYFESTGLSIATPIEWSDDKIIVTVNQGAFNFHSGDEFFVHVVDAGGNVSLLGFPVAVEAVSGEGDDSLNAGGGCFLSAISLPCNPLHLPPPPKNP
jgi:hypothetical protein